MVEAASSWSAMSTRAAFTAAVGTGTDASAPRRPASLDAKDLAGVGSSPCAGAAAGSPTTSTSAAAMRRVARATDSGRRSERSGSVAPHMTSAQRMRSMVVARGQVPSSGRTSRRRSGTARAIRPRPRRASRRRARWRRGRGKRVPLLMEPGHRGGDGGEPGGGTALPPPGGQRLDLAQVEEAAPGSRVPLRLEQAAADVGVERRDLDPETPGGLLCRQHAVHVEQSSAVTLT